MNARAHGLTDLNPHEVDVPAGAIVGYTALVSCGDCGMPVRNVQVGRVEINHAGALCECSACGARWMLDVNLARAPREWAHATGRQRARRAQLREVTA